MQGEKTESLWKNEEYRLNQCESMTKLDIDVNSLKNEYLSGKSVPELATKYNCSLYSIWNRLKKAGIKKFKRGFQKGHKGRKTFLDKTHTKLNREKIRQSQIGEKNSNWKGGTSKLKGICKMCGKKILIQKAGRDKVRFCSNKCAHEMMSGINHPCYGIKRTEEQNEANRQNMIKRRSNGEFSNYLGTSIERKMENWLLFNDILYVNQYPYKLGVADFWLPESNLIIHCDGTYWHSNQKVVERDIRQDKWLEQNDYLSIRLKEEYINNNFKKCINEIKEFI